MTSRIGTHMIGKRLAVLLSLSVLTPVAALAQEAAVPAAPAAAPSESAMVNLVRALIKQKALRPDVGAALIQQAEAEAALARDAAAAAAAKLAAAAPPRDLPAAPAGTIRVPYIPESVRAQIKDELRNEVMAEAKQGGWASAGQAAPDWTRRLTLHGDIRVRSESTLYARTNAQQVFDFAAINAFGPYGFEDPRVFVPYLNTRNNQLNNVKLRARIGLDIAVAKGVTAGITVATGDNNGPISNNTLLGGGFAARDIWLDQAWVKVQPTSTVGLVFGRFANPFTSSYLLYDPDLKFDGFAAEVNSAAMLGDDLKLTLRGGAFPYDTGNPNYPTFEFNKPKAPQKWLFAGQIQADAKFGDAAVRLAVGYHDFHRVQSQLSTPCQTDQVSFCSTDYLQPVYMTKGNTLSPLRQALTPLTANDTTKQLLGYTFQYRILDANAAVTVGLDDELSARLSGSYVRNLGFRLSDICRNGVAGRPYNNNASGTGTYCDPTNPAKFAGGKTGYRGELLVGHLDPTKRGQWNVFGGYRYLESDAVLDGLTDSDFHQGGTNTKGYFVGGNFVVTDGLLIGGRWMSANEIAGPKLGIDVLQLDMQVNF